jgi:hypothetical protein
MPQTNFHTFALLLQGRIRATESYGYSRLFVQGCDPFVSLPFPPASLDASLPPFSSLAASAGDPALPVVSVVEVPAAAVLTLLELLPEVIFMYQFRQKNLTPGKYYS